jgi:hypothetical protein
MPEATPRPRVVVVGDLVVDVVLAPATELQIGNRRPRPGDAPPGRLGDDHRPLARPGGARVSLVPPWGGTPPAARSSEDDPWGRRHTAGRPHRRAADRPGRRVSWRRAASAPSSRTAARHSPGPGAPARGVVRLCRARPHPNLLAARSPARRRRDGWRPNSPMPPERSSRWTCRRPVRFSRLVTAAAIEVVLGARPDLLFAAGTEARALATTDEALLDVAADRGPQARPGGRHDPVPRGTEARGSRWRPGRRRVRYDRRRRRLRRRLHPGLARRPARRRLDRRRPAARRGRGPPAREPATARPREELSFD